jgi:carbonic anhydrase
MNLIEMITQRNEEFVRSGHSADLKIIPSTKTIIIGCLDPRVDGPGLEPCHSSSH